ncbi:abortive infection family protein [Allobaculum sp. JKK-2023]|uniref:abortive infection family protein n=1 Tax=Allobaculum sp. JKK-2023 TaxID=3108943 RepID=UPI002B0540F7|nr:abortive infection family protein [Allobaculum sp. JKK-2023]
MNFNYIFPDNFKSLFEMYARAMKLDSLIEPLSRCEIKHHDLGFAYYAGLRGYWDYHALDVDIIGMKQDLDIIEMNKNSFIIVFDKALDPENTGLVSREFLFIPNSQPSACFDSQSAVTLPDESDPLLKTLSFDIIGKIENGEADLALDRLHTYTTKFIRNKCEDIGLVVKKENGDNLPLQSLMGNLCKYYRENNLIESEFSLRALKSSISLMDAFNEVRNKQSYAHVNQVLNKNESKLVVEIVTSILNFIQVIQPDYSEFKW